MVNEVLTENEIDFLSKEIVSKPKTRRNKTMKKVEKEQELYTNTDTKIEILSKEDGVDILKQIESFSRLKYVSEGIITNNSCFDFVEGAIKRGDEDILEHAYITVKFIYDSFLSQIITKSSNAYLYEPITFNGYYNNGKLVFINPEFDISEEDGTDFLKKAYSVVNKLYQESAKAYSKLIKLGVSVEDASCVLPHGIKTEILMTANLKEWRNFIKAKTSRSSSVAEKKFGEALLIKMQDKVPVAFDDLWSFVGK